MLKPLAAWPNSVKQQMAYAAGIVSTKAVAVLMLPVFTHFLTPLDYARLDIIQTMANLTSIVIAFGLSDSLFRFSGESSALAVRRHMAAATFSLALMTFIVGIIVTQLLAPFIAQALPGGISLFQTRTMLVSLSVTACILVPLAWLRMQGRAGMFFLATAGWTTCQAGITAVALFFGYGIDGVLVSGLICSLVLAIILSVYQLNSTGICLSGELLKAQGRFGGMLVLAGIAAFIIDSSGRWILASVAGVLALAEYALAWKVGIMALLFTEPFALWWMPKRFAILNEVGKEQCARTAEIGVVIALIAVVVVSSVGALVITLLSPPEYHGAIQYVPAFALLAGIKAMTNLFTISILSEKKTLYPIYIDSGAAIVALSGNFLLIPYFHAWGAIYALTIALIVRLILYVWIGQRVKPIPYNLRRIGLLFCLTIIITVVSCQASTPLNTFIIGACGGVLLLVIALFTGSVPASMALTRFKIKPGTLSNLLYTKRK